ncbi:MAG: hypothetical protein COB15_02305 [Flavobacteriales bacterium]|nr:MAG: hypothetical protein COB15_02305 [Flavobacteriales bacterium]
MPTTVFKPKKIKFLWKLFFYSLLLFFCLNEHLVGQQLENEEAYNQIHMLRIKQENDLYQYWYKSDKDFTDGFHIEFSHSIFNTKWANWMLIGFKNNVYDDFTLSLGQDIFTPENTEITTLDTTDRPYSALLYLSYSKFSNNFFKGQKLFSNLYMGLCGRNALGKEIQNGVHGMLGNSLSYGWDNQLNTGLMLDYDLTYNQLLPISSNFFETSYFGKAHLGTIYNYVSAGINFKIGHYTDSYINQNGIYNPRNKKHINQDNFQLLSKTKRKLIPKRIRKLSLSEQINYLNERMNRKFQLFFFLSIQSSYSLYDGTAAGSLIQFETNNYTFNTDNTEQIIVMGEYGINFQYNRFYINFNRFLENNAFQKGELFGFGEISLSYIF